MADKKIIDIRPPQSKEPGIKEAKTEESPRFSFPKISRPSISFPRVSKIFFLLPLLAIGGLVAYFALGKAQIEIWPKLDPLTLETKITVDKSVQSSDALQKIIPGVLFEDTAILSGEFPASGKKSVEEKAEGVIRVYNNSSLAQTLVANTRFQPPLEKFEKPLQGEENPWFRLRSRIVISPKSFADAEVVADASGEKYNIKPSKFSVPGLAGSAQYTLVFGESFQQFTGGEKKELYQILNKDLEDAQELLFQKSKTEGEGILREKVPQDYLFLVDASKTELLEGSSLSKVGEQSVSFNYKVSTRSSILTSKYEESESLIKNLLAARLPDGKEMDETSLKTDYALFSIDKNSGKMVLSSRSSVNTFSPADEAFLKNGLLGKSLQEARTILEKQEGFQKIKIHLWPFWLKSVPKNIEKVKIEIRLGDEG